MERTLEQQRITLDQEKWRDELKLRERELDLRERQQKCQDEEIRLKREDLNRSRWSSPLIIAILKAAAAATGNLLVNWENSVELRRLEKDRADETRDLEKTKAEAARILEVVKTADPDKAAANLQVLMEAHLISEPSTRGHIEEYLAKRIPGQGLGIPAPTETPRPLRPIIGALDQDRWRKRAGNGAYHWVAGALEVYTHEGNLLMAADDSMIRKDFNYSLRTELVSGSTQLGFGLVFGMEDSDKYFLFAKRTAGDYRLTQKQGGQERVILPWTNSGLITAVNRPQTLQVVSKGTFVTLLADGQKLQAQQVSVGREPAGGVGLFVDSPGLSVLFFDSLFSPL
jgi:hypothetical protein